MSTSLVKRANRVHPEIKDIMNVTDGKKVLPLLEDNTMVQVPKIIPLPTFLVPLFMNKGKPRSAVASFQAFVDKFFQEAPNTIKKYMQYIFDYLLAASGFEDDEDNNDMTSQLAIHMEEMELNPVMMQWASTHFGSVEKIATHHKKCLQKERAQQHSTSASGNLGKQTPVDLLHPLQGATHITNKEGPQNLTDAGIALQATHHATNTVGIQNPMTSTANLGQGSASISITGGTKNLHGTTQASNNVPNTMNTQGAYNQNQTQGWMPGPFSQDIRGCRDKWPLLSQQPQIHGTPSTQDFNPHHKDLSRIHNHKDRHNRSY